MIYKYSFKIIALVASIYGAGWCFNHINAWIGILLGVGIFMFSLNTIINLIKKNTK